MPNSHVHLCPDLCRLCLNKKGVNDILKDSDLVQDIYLCTGVMVGNFNQ